MWLPTMEQVLRLHRKLIAHTGGSHGVRDQGLIESALARASAGFDGYEQYPSAQEKAAAICHGLIGNHGFVDGNKRIGIAVMLLILRWNGITLQYTQRELVLLGLSIATGEMAETAIVEWIHTHTDQPAE